MQLFHISTAFGSESRFGLKVFNSVHTEAFRNMITKSDDSESPFTTEVIGGSGTQNFDKKNFPS